MKPYEIFVGIVGVLVALLAAIALLLFMFKNNFGVG